MSNRPSNAAECQSALRDVWDRVRQSGLSGGDAEYHFRELARAIECAATAAHEAPAASRATVRQISTLERFGIDGSCLTKAEASQQIKTLADNGWKLPPKPIPRAPLASREPQEVEA